MKIALAVHDYHRQGGHSRYTVELSERLARNHEVHVFANTIDSGGNTGIRFHSVPALRATALTTILSFPVPATAMLGCGFDIVHAQGFVCFGANVVTAHICNRAWYDARRRSGDSIRPHERLFGAVVNRIEAVHYRRGKTSEIIAVSELVRHNLADAYGRGEHVTVIPHGVDLERFTPDNRDRHRAKLRSELGISPSTLVALWVGDLRKGAMAAIDVVADTPNWHLLTVSRTDSARYAEHARLRSVAARVTLAPATNEVERYYAAADAFLFPSSYDAFGMVVTEAMASGLPVLVSRAAGAAELVRMGESGAVLDVGASPADYARHLLAWSADPVSLLRMGAAARDAVLPFTWDEITRQTFEVYERAVSRCRT